MLKNSEMENEIENARLEIEKVTKEAKRRNVTQDEFERKMESMAREL